MPSLSRMHHPIPRLRYQDRALRTTLKQLPPRLPGLIQPFLLHPPPLTILNLLLTLRDMSLETRLLSLSLRLGRLPLLHRFIQQRPLAAVVVKFARELLVVHLHELLKLPGGILRCRQPLTVRLGCRWLGG